MSGTGGLCELAVGFPVWHLAFNLLARDLARGLSNSLLVEALGFFLLLGRAALTSWP